MKKGVQMKRPVRSIKNQYLGINAHLHSYWQADGDWREFHTSYIVGLVQALKAQLLPMGYTAGIEKSLQIRYREQPDSEPESDITIYDRDPGRTSRSPQAPATSEYATVLALPEVLDYEEEPAQFRSIAVYEAEPGGERGEPIAWIEVLSPSNKPTGQHGQEYRIKRRKLLDRAIVFVEVDYLHESPPTFSRLPSYRIRGKRQARSADAHPYRIIVIDPRPLISDGKLYLYEFNVDDPMPTVTIPLNDRDSIHFDFGVPYHKILQEMFFAYEFVDYRQPPKSFDRYSLADQTRIAQRMVSVLEAAEASVDLETGPFPVQTMTLESALAHITKLNHE